VYNLLELFEITSWMVCSACFQKILVCRDQTENFGTVFKEILQ
jgi:hypothetical protein